MANQTDVEYLFAVGDVVKIRVKSVDTASRRLELTMYPPRNREEDEDDYIVEGRDPEGEEDNTVFDDVEEVEEFDPEDALLWWRGARYVKVRYEDIYM